MALGELIAEGQGKIIQYRVLPSEGPAPRGENSMRGNTKVLGVEAVEIATWWGVARPTGVFFGEGQGIITTKDGEAVTYSGHGIGTPKGVTATSWRGAVYMQTSSQKLARLSKIVLVYEWDSDENENYTSKSWEWK